MSVIMCTERLWKRVSKTKLPRLADVAPAHRGRLGNWSAKPITLRRRPFALFVNQKTLLCVLVRLAPSKTLFQRFPEALGQELIRLGVGEEDRLEEMAAVSSAAFARNADRSLVGSVNDLAFHIEAIAETLRWLGDEPDYVAVHAALNSIPHVKRESAFAEDAVRAMFSVQEPKPRVGLTELALRRVDRLLTEFCDRVPAHVRDQLRHGYRVEDSTVTLYEERPWFRDPSEWIELSVAQFRVEAGTGYWRLYCSDRDGCWHLYMGVPATPNLQDLLDEVQRDPTGIFWG